MGKDPASLGEVFSRLAVKLREAGFAESGLEAQLLLAHVLQIEPGQIRLRPEILVTADTFAQAEALIERRKAGEPVAYLTGRREFWSLSFRVGPGVLVPRPDTETLVEAVLEARPDTRAALRILDLGTGSGCLLAALLHEYPLALGVAIDLSDKAVQIARQNLSALGLVARAELHRGSWFEPVEGAFDVIVSNPPYITPTVIETLAAEVRDHEPRLALDGGEDGLEAYRQIFSGAKAHLAPEGLIAVEIGYDQGATVPAVARENGLYHVVNHQDLSGHPRVIAASMHKKGLGKLGVTE